MQKTPPKFEEKPKVNVENPLEKLSPPRKAETCNITNNSYPLNETRLVELEFKTVGKISSQNAENQSLESQISKKKTSLSCTEDFDLKSDLMQSCDGEDGLISTADQARLLIEANKTPSKSINKTPVKENTPNGKRSIENSPVTPGKYKRVELTTLASPKAKKIKQI